MPVSPASPTFDDVRRLVAKAFPRREVVGCEPLSGGYCNTNIRVIFSLGHEPIVLRIYDRDPAACSTETEILRHVRDTVPVPEVFYAESDSQFKVGPFCFARVCRGSNILAVEGDKGPRNHPTGFGFSWSYARSDWRLSVFQVWDAFSQ